MPGVNHGVRGGKSLGWLVVIGNDHIDAQFPGMRHLFNIGTGTIGGDEQRGTTVLQLVKRLNVETTTIAEPVGDVIVQEMARMSKRAQGTGQQSSRGDTIGVVVTIDCDPPPSLNRLVQ